MSPASATEVAFLVVAVVQGVFALLWIIGASLVSERRPLIYWCVWSALSATTWLTLGMNIESPPLLGVLAGVVGVISLERGVSVFIGRAVRNRLHIALPIAVVVANLSLVSPQTQHLQAVLNYGVLTWVYLNVARDMERNLIANATVTTPRARTPAISCRTRYIVGSEHDRCGLFPYNPRFR